MVSKMEDILSSVVDDSLHIFAGLDESVEIEPEGTTKAVTPKSTLPLNRAISTATLGRVILGAIVRLENKETTLAFRMKKIADVVRQEESGSR